MMTCANDRKVPAQKAQEPTSANLASKLKTSSPQLTMTPQRGVSSLPKSLPTKAPSTKVGATDPAGSGSPSTITVVTSFRQTQPARSQSSEIFSSQASSGESASNPHGMPFAEMSAFSTSP